MKRTKLFKMQGMLSILLILLAGIQIALDSNPGDLLKIAIAPFGTVSLLLFAFFVYNKGQDTLSDDDTYPISRILINLGLAAIAGVAVVFLTNQISDLTSTLDKVIFSFSMLIGVVVFIYEKLRDFKSMAILTGIGEGIAILLIFFR